jgi:hypothetical protein
MIVSENRFTLFRIMPYALVAQLDRASDFDSEGREFESLRARHFTPEHATARMRGRLCAATHDQPPWRCPCLLPGHKVRNGSLPRHCHGRSRWKAGREIDSHGNKIPNCRRSKHKLVYLGRYRNEQDRDLYGAIRRSFNNRFGRQRNGVSTAHDLQSAQLHWQGSLWQRLL